MFSVFVSVAEKAKLGIVIVESKHKMSERYLDILNNDSVDLKKVIKLWYEFSLREIKLNPCLLVRLKYNIILTMCKVTADCCSHFIGRR